MSGLLSCPAPGRMGWRDDLCRLGGKMTTEPPKGRGSERVSAQSKRADRDGRLASALRRNLLKRKDQQRARETGAVSEDTE